MQTSIKRGFALIEVIISVTIISGALLIIVAAASRSFTYARINQKNYQATLATEEAVEAIKSIRAESWSTNISPLTIGTAYGITLGTNNWGIAGTPQTENGFTRTIIFNNAYRDGNDDLASSGTLDSGMRLVQVTTTWTYQNKNYSQVLEFYIANVF